MSLTVHDISVPNHPGMLHYGRKPEKTMVESIADGDPGNVSRWLIGSHTGTHVDAPAHFVEGATTIEDVPLDDPRGSGGRARPHLRHVVARSRPTTSSPRAWTTASASC